MINHSEILQLCRLCLVEEKVNHSIFEETGDLRTIFLKITSCLPVTIREDDSLPKKICESCSTKLDSFYQFWNETANAEKQLLQWLEETSLGTLSKSGQTELNKSRMEDTEIKQENIDVVDNNIENMEMSSDAKTYILQQQQLPYSSSPPKILPTTNETEEPVSKRPRRASAMKALEQMESEDDDDADYAGDNYAKSESDDSDKEDEDETFQEGDGPSTSMDDQPGPSGLGKGSSDAPSRRNHIIQNNGRTTDEIEIIDLVHDENNEKTEELDDCLIKVKCPECDEQFSYNCEFLYHYKSCHEAQNEEEEDDEVKSLQEQNGTHSTQEMDEHQGGDFTCEYCARRFATRKGLGKHRSIRHRDQKYTCNVCLQEFPSGFSLEEHIKTHSGIKPFKCLECGRKFSAKKFLLIHEKAHSKDKPFTCELCYKSFTQKSTLTVHIRYHTGERPYVCTICSKGFVTKTLMKKHIKTHGIS